MFPLVTTHGQKIGVESFGAGTDPLQPMFPFYRDANIYLTQMFYGQSSATISVNLLHMVGIVVPFTRTFTSIACVVNTLAAGNARLGIYNVASDGGPGTLILDAGTVSVNTTGVKTIAISQALSAGTRYYLAMVTDISVVMATSNQNHTTFGLNPSAGTTTRIPRLTRSFTYAALPADESAQTYALGSGTTHAPVIGIR